MKKPRPRRIISITDEVWEFDTPEGKAGARMLSWTYHRPWAWVNHIQKIPTKLAALLKDDEGHVSHISAIKDKLELLFDEGWGYHDYAPGPELDPLGCVQIPLDLVEIMLAIQGDIRRNVLILNHVPTKMWMQISRMAPARKAIDNDQDISNAILDDMPIPMSLAVMYDTEEVADTRERADIVFNRWYPHAANKIMKETDESCEILRSEIAEAIAKFSSAERILISLEQNPPARAIWFALEEEEWKLSEIADGAKRWGIMHATPDSIKRDIQKINDKLLEYKARAIFAKKVWGIDKIPE